MRGEHASASWSVVVLEGSSPHARGARVLLHLLHAQRRIIPACAGSTHAMSGRQRRGEDHPRMRGEHMLQKVGVKCFLGSSPHARGAHEGVRDAPLEHGIIPACAGSTRHWACPPSTGRDHPRMRGEH